MNHLDPKVSMFNLITRSTKQKGREIKGHSLFIASTFVHHYGDGHVLLIDR